MKLHAKFLLYRRQQINMFQRIPLLDIIRRGSICYRNFFVVKNVTENFI